nr:hypothetical protein [Kingella oralis]
MEAIGKKSVFLAAHGKAERKGDLAEIVRANRQQRLQGGEIVNIHNAVHARNIAAPLDVFQQRQNGGRVFLRASAHLAQHLRVSRHNGVACDVVRIGLQCPLFFFAQLLLKGFS